MGHDAPPDEDIDIPSKAKDFNETPNALRWNEELSRKYASLPTARAAGPYVADRREAGLGHWPAGTTTFVLNQV